MWEFFFSERFSLYKVKNKKTKRTWNSQTGSFKCLYVLNKNEIFFSVSNVVNAIFEIYHTIQNEIVIVRSKWGTTLYVFICYIRIYVVRNRTRIQADFPRGFAALTFRHNRLSRPAFMDTCSGVLEWTVIATPFELMKYRPSTLPHRCRPTCPVTKGDISTRPNWTGHAMPSVRPPPYLQSERGAIGREWVGVGVENSTALNW